MSEKWITRRQAIKLAGLSVITGGMAGCGPAAAAGRVIVPVALKAITRVVSCVLKYSDKALTLIALVESVQRTINASLNAKQATDLKNGGTLFIRTQDGTEHEVPYTVD